jgi:pimeloyl-ACP methyl ester carboxylesterase
MYFALALMLAAPPADPIPPPRLLGELVVLKTDTGVLHGTLDLPAKPGPWPVVLLHAGSGPTNRDGNGPGILTDCLKQTGRALAAEGFAVLRIDKRGIGLSALAMTKVEDLRVETYSADVTAWVEFLRKDARFAKIGFIGHSEGALIGLIAAKDAKFDAFVSLCGPGRPLQDVLREQLKKNLSDDLFKQSDAIITELEAGRTVKDVPKDLVTLFRPNVQPYLVSEFKHDPAKLAKGVAVPFLIVSGSTDIQVSAADAKCLAGAAAKAKLVTVNDMNHVLKVVKGTNQLVQFPSYFDPALPLHPELVPALVEFLKGSMLGK